MLFAGSLGDDDVKLFKYHAKDEKWTGTLYELNVASDITFDWNHRNFDKGKSHGKDSATELLNFYFCMKHYFKEEYVKAERYADALTREDYSLGQVAKAVTYYNLSEMMLAAQAIDCLLRTDIVWYKTPEVELGKTFYKPGQATKVFNDLQKAGLPQ